MNEDTVKPLSTEVCVERTKPAFISGFLVWGVWAAMLLAALFFVGRYGKNVPFYDDWGLVSYMTGTRSVTPTSLWAQADGHRYPLTRILLLALATLTNGDFRAAMVLNVLLLGAAAAGMILASRRLRGRTVLADAFFPCILLHWGHFESLLEGINLTVVLSATLAGFLLMIIVRHRDPRTLGYGIAPGICLLSLPLASGRLLPFVLALAPWLAWAGVVCWRSSAKRQGVVLIGWAAAGLLLLGLYLVDFHRSPQHPPNPGIGRTLNTSLQFLTTGLGPAGRMLWPSSAVAISLLVILSMRHLAARVREQRQELFRAVGLTLFLAGLAVLALAVGWGRAGLQWDAGFACRYTTLATLLWCAIFFIFGIGSPMSNNLTAQISLLLLFGSLVLMDARNGAENGESRRQLLAAFERDAAAGMSCSRLAERYAPIIYPSKKTLEDEILELQRAGIGPYRFLRKRLNYEP